MAMKKKVLALFLSALIAVQAIVPVAAELEEVTIEENLEEEDETENDLISEEILSEDTEIILDEPEDIFEEEQIIEDELTFSEETSFIQDDFLEEESLDDSGIIVEEETTEEISEDYIFEEEELVEESMSEDYDLNAGEIELVGVSSGTCGSNLTWTLTDDGVLTISGTGSMDDWGVVYDETNEAHPTTPWVGTVKKVVIMSGVTSIGKYAFYKCSSLTSVTIPDSVTSIGSKVFPCPDNKNIDIHIGNLTAWCQMIIDGDMFDGWMWDESGYDLYLDNYVVSDLVIPDSITEIGEHAFSRCQSLKKVTIPEQVKRIG